MRRFTQEKLAKVSEFDPNVKPLKTKTGMILNGIVNNTPILVVL
jgi:hypothetical protein